MQRFIMRLNILFLSETESDKQELSSSLSRDRCHAHIGQVQSIEDMLEYSSQESIDIVIVDMPQDTLVDIAKVVLQNPQLISLPIIYLLDKDNSELTEKLHDLAVKYIVYEKLTPSVMASYIYVLLQKGRYKKQLNSMGSYMKEATIVCEKDAEGDFCFAHINKAFLELEEGNVNNIIGKKVKDSHLLFGLKNLIEDMQEVQDTQDPIHMPNYFYLKDGQREWCDVYIYNSNSEQISVISSSLSEVKRAHDKSTQSNRYLQTILNAQHHIIYITDGLKLINTNQAFLDFFECDTMHQFIKEHEKVCNIFEKATEPFYINTNEPQWHKKVSENTQERYKIRIRHDGIVKVFVPSVEVIEVDEKEQYVVILTDVTELESEKEKLRLLAMTDVLTGISNRLKFNTSIEHFVENTNRYDTPLSVVMFDIDHFKRVNDEFSHQKGDEVLVELTKLVSSKLRKADLFVRWGGEEFLILLPNTTKDHAAVAAEKIRKHIEQMVFEELGSVTCSFGVTSMIQEETVSDLIAHADEALYEAKGAGRNCIKEA
jgi:diguanylate cyclase (GGDEF)-like protein